MVRIENFFGNLALAETLAHMAEQDRVPQTILLGGPEGVGKATLARRFGMLLVGDAEKIERDDLSLPANVEVIETREKWPAEKRNDDPLFFSTHPDFVTFAPDGPLAQITIQQMRLLRERAQLRPLRGNRRVFVIDHLERANEQAANSLLKVLEEPPEHLIIIGTTENLYDLLPTIRSRSVVFQLGRLSEDEMQAFARARNLTDSDARIVLAGGSPGVAVKLDLAQFRERRALIVSALECGSQIEPFSTWVAQSESFLSRKSEKLETYLKLAYSVLEDVLRAHQGCPAVISRDIQQRITAIGQKITFEWIERAVKLVDELVEMARRNIQKGPAMDAFVIGLRNLAARELH